MKSCGGTYERIICSCICCKNTISANNLIQHFRSKQCLSGFKASLRPASVNIPNNFVCFYCLKQCRSNNSYIQHSIRCAKNPQKIDIKNDIGERSKGRSPWNKGQTKETNSVIAEQSKNLSLIFKEKAREGKLPECFCKEYWTADRKLEKSKWRIQLHNSYPECHPNRLLSGNRKKMTYPEKIAFEFLEKQGFIFEHQKKILNFFVDFCIDNIIIEIDGEKWHPLGNEKDAKRDLQLSNIGYVVYRIRSKENIQNRLQQILSR